MAGSTILGLGAGGTVLAILVLALVILLPMSFSYLDYYEMGFTRRRTTGNVDTENVYSSGRHLIGPDHEFKEFYASAQYVSFQHIPIFTTDNLQVNISIELQFFLIKDDLKLLHDAFDIFYNKIIVDNAKDALKNSVTKFDTDEFISNRTVIQNELFYGVRERLSGACCLPGCLKTCSQCEQWQLCTPNCKPRSQCTKADKGLFVEVRYLQLHDIDIPYQVNERRLRSLITDLEREREKSIKEEMIVRKQTDYEVGKIQNRANELLENSTATSQLIVNQAHTNYSQSIETVHNVQLKKMYEELAFTTPKHKTSLNYIRSLKDHDKIKYSIDFNTLVLSAGSK